MQVRDQVDAGLFEIRDLVEGGVPAYLEQELSPGQTVGYDPRLHSPDALDNRRAATARAGAKLKPIEDNPARRRLGEPPRPAQPLAPVVPHPLDYAGEESAAKRARVGANLKDLGADAAVLTSPASIAWLFNIRGGDVIRSPLPLSQAILKRDGTAQLFLDPAKVSDNLPAWLGNQVGLATPGELPAALKALKRRAGAGRSGPVACLVFREPEVTPAPMRGARALTPAPCPAPVRIRSRSKARAALMCAMARR